MTHITIEELRLMSPDAVKDAADMLRVMAKTMPLDAGAQSALLSEVSMLEYIAELKGQRS